jgi:DnaJ-domain-containing protein 1
MSALLGWWSIPSWFFYGWRSTYFNWRSVWKAPADPVTWGGIPLEDLLSSVDEEAAEAAHFADSPLADLTVAERHVVMSVEDPYGTLQVSANATEAEIKASWRDLAKKRHPDSNPDDADATTRMATLNQAYEVLRDDRLRAAYDWLAANGEKAA